MGHTRLGELPRTRAWTEVVDLLACGAATEQVATATINAAERALNLASDDRAVVETVYLLMQLPLAARGGDMAAFVSQLRGAGLNVSDQPGLMEVVGTFSDAVDARLPKNIGRTDLGEMAQMAAAEAITAELTARTQNLFGAQAHDVQRAFAQLATNKNFSAFARRFFARLTNRCMEYFLSRAFALHVGEGRRFATLAQRAEFSKALEVHCREASVIVERFSGDWFSKTKWELGGVPREAAGAFAYGAMRKLVDELKMGARALAQ